jgi:Cu(I)/Ag(I) efflux system membrane fusion protein
MLELYPEDASQIRFGQVVRAELTSLPGKELTGRVAFIDPTVNDSNRTVGVRVEFKNDDGELRPGDYAQATIEIPIGPQGEVYDAELAGKWISPMHPQIIRDEPGDCPICGMNLVPTSRYGYTDQPVAHAQSITIPRSALLMAGEHSVVYVETEPGRFELRTVSLGPILADQVVILDGLEPGERVATSGNFLIDSQMQLAGKPSLIDPTRHVAKQDNPNAPLELKGIHVTQLEGAAGEHLEHLFQAYFEIQQALANDSVPSEQSVLAVDRGAANLLAESKLPEKVQKELKIIQDNIPHLHHLAIDEVRVKFKALSHAAIRLAAQVRGEKAEVAFHHFFCPMVKNGNGDWLQPDKMLSNPYYGSEMLRCGELVRTIPTSDPSSVVPEDDHTEQKHPATEERLEGDR